MKSPQGNWHNLYFKKFQEGHLILQQPPYFRRCSKVYWNLNIRICVKMKQKPN